MPSSSEIVSRHGRRYIECDVLQGPSAIGKDCLEEFISDGNCGQNEKCMRMCAPSAKRGPEAAKEWHMKGLGGCDDVEDQGRQHQDACH